MAEGCNTVRVCMFQTLLANKHLWLRDSQISLVKVEWRSRPLDMTTKKKILSVTYTWKVKVATLAHSVSEVIPSKHIYYSLRNQRFYKTKQKYILYTIKDTNQKKRYIPQNNENTIRNIVRVQRLASKHYRMRDLKLAARRSASGYRQGKKINRG